MPWLERRLGNCNRNGKMDCASIVVIHTHLNTNRSCPYATHWELNGGWWLEEPLRALRTALATDV